MGQTWLSDIYEPGITYSTTMQQIETNFASLRTMFSGPTAPSSPVAGMPWLDSTNQLLKIRNVANNEWLGIFWGSEDHRMFIYENSAIDGWVVYSNTVDRVIAIKGGSTYITGGTTAGSWDIGGLTYPHTHDIASHNHTFTGGSHYHHNVNIGGTAGWAWAYNMAEETTTTSHSHTSSNATDTTPSASPNATGNSFRPAAVVFTIQYIDL